MATRAQRVPIEGPRSEHPAGAGRRQPATPTAVDAHVEGLVASPRLVRPCLLLLLHERPSHGYELSARLDRLGADHGGPETVYRALQWLHTSGFVLPTWQTGTGPARRVFEVTPAGEQALDLAMGRLRRQAKALDNGVGRYLLSRMRARARQQRSFQLVMQAHLSVQALDEVTARRKVERAFGTARSLDNDVRGTGLVSVAPALVGASA